MISKTGRPAAELRKHNFVKAYLTPEERDEVTAKAKSLGLSLSEFIRRVVTRTPLPSRDRAEAVRDLLKINADLARLGNLMIMAMDDEDFPKPRDPNLDPERLLEKIRNTQEELKAKVRAL